MDILGVQKLNTSGYHPQTDGLVEKFNSTLINIMVAKSSDSVKLEWDQQLLFAYRLSVQESTKESPFFLLYGQDPRLPTSGMLNQVNGAYLVDMEDYRTEFLVGMAKAHQIAVQNIRKAQARQIECFTVSQKTPSTVLVKESWYTCLVMLQGRIGNLRDLTTVHFVLSVTSSNAEVQLIEKPQNPSLFVSLSRLRHCQFHSTSIKKTKQLLKIEK